MVNEEKEYTVKEIAEFTGLTTRTIRNYIKTGKLSGKKIARQWRFTDEDVSNLKQVVNKRSKFEKMQLYFLNNLNECNLYIPHSCCICCYPSKPIKEINRIRSEIKNKMKNCHSDFSPDFFYHYNYNKKQSEFILIGANEQVDKMKEIIIEHIKKK